MKIWDISDLKGDILPEMKSTGNDTKLSYGGRASVENRSDVDSGIDDREFRDRRAQNMV